MDRLYKWTHTMDSNQKEKMFFNLFLAILMTEEVLNFQHASFVQYN